VRALPTHAGPRAPYGCSWEGKALPGPPAGGGVGKPGFPHTPAPGKVLPGRAAPPPGGGLGKPGFPRPLREGQALPRAGVWGNRVSPHPCSRKGSSWEGCAPTGWGCGETRFPHALAPGKVLPGRAAPSHRVGVWGNRVSPHPSPRAYFHVSERLRRHGHLERG